MKIAIPFDTFIHTVDVSFTINSTKGLITILDILHTKACIVEHCKFSGKIRI